MTEEDIISLGWTKCLFYFKMQGICGGFFLCITQGTCGFDALIVWGNEVANSETVFFGNITTKQQLETVMMQVGIIKINI